MEKLTMKQVLDAVIEPQPAPLSVRKIGLAIGINHGTIHDWISRGRELDNGTLLLLLLSDNPLARQVFRLACPGRIENVVPKLRRILAELEAAEPNGAQPE